MRTYWSAGDSNDKDAPSVRWHPPHRVVGIWFGSGLNVYLDTEAAHDLVGRLQLALEEAAAGPPEPADDAE